eukprot:jgi/Chlat1/8439/Chrsp80S07852
MFFGYRPPPTENFEQNYVCYSVSFIDKPHLENGDKVILPPSALDRLASLHIEYPMLFEIENGAEGRRSHCGVLEFIADEGVIYMPYWMMQNLLLEEGDLVKLRSATLPKGTYVKLRPHSSDFLEITNPKAVLETSLRSFSCLTSGDSIMVAYNNKKYYIDIVETKPSHAVSIIETDCEVDFAPPLDYVEPVRPAPAAPIPAVQPAAQPQTSTAPAPEAPSEEPKFSAFTGSARRLDGKAAAKTSPATSASSTPVRTPSPVPSAAATTTAPAAAGPSSSSATNGPASGLPAGKLVFGSRPSQPQQSKEAPKTEEPKKEDEGPKFQAFQGKSYRLK